jgi:hypothetical protein
MTPYPGTKVYEMALQREGGYRLLSEDWSQYDKYGGKALEVGNLSFKRLSYWQAWAMVYFYLRNFRFLDLAKFFVQYIRGIVFLFMKFVTRLGKRE